MSAESSIPLDQLPHNCRGRIVKIGDEASVTRDDMSDDAAAPMQDLLLDLGFEVGATVEIRHQGLFGGPLAVQVDDRLIALRPSDAAVVLVSPETGA